MLQARGRLLQEELRRNSGQDCCYGEEPKSPASASMTASVEVQVGESLSNLRLSDDGASVSAQHRAGQKPRPQVFRAKVLQTFCYCCYTVAHIGLTGDRNRITLVKKNSVTA